MHDVSAADRDEVQLAGQPGAALGRRPAEGLDAQARAHRHRMQVAARRIGAHDGVGQPPAQFVLEDPREEQVAEVRDVERPEEPDARSARVRQLSANRVGRVELRRARPEYS